MNLKKERIIEYARSLGIVEIPSPSFTIIDDGTYYGLPELIDSAWIIRIYKKDKVIDIVKDAYITSEGIVMTTQAVDVSKLNWKYHLKSLVSKIRKLELVAKEQKENARIAKMENDFND